MKKLVILGCLVMQLAIPTTAYGNDLDFSDSSIKNLVSNLKTEDNEIKNKVKSSIDSIIKNAMYNGIKNLISVITSDIDIDKIDFNKIDVDEINFAEIKSNILEYKNFNEENQLAIENAINEEFEKGNYTAENPLIVVNPYEVSPLTALVMFNTEKPSNISVTVKGKDESVDITNTFTETSKMHTIPILGLYSGANNEVIVDVNYEDGTTESYTYNIETEDVADDFYDVDMETNLDTDSHGDLIFFEGHRNFAVDNNGDIRWCFDGELLNGNMVSPIRLLQNGNIAIFSGKVQKLPYYSNSVFELNYLGKIVSEYDVPHSHHEIVELPNDNLLVPSKNPNRETEEDYIVEVDRNTGEIVKTIDLYDILDIEKVADDGYLPVIKQDDDDSRVSIRDIIANITSESNKIGWFHLNSMCYDDGSLVVSGRHQDMVVCLDYCTEEIKWILTDPANKDLPEDLQEKLLIPTIDDFEYPYGQHAVDYNDGLLTLYDNGNNRYDENGNPLNIEDRYSRGVVYSVDEDNMTIHQIWEFGQNESFDTYTPYIGDIDTLGENHYLINFGGMILKNGKQYYSILEGFIGGGTASRIVEIENGEIITNVMVNDDGYSNVYRASKRNIYEKQKELDI